MRRLSECTATYHGRESITIRKTQRPAALSRISCGAVRRALQWSEKIVSEQDEEGVAMIAHDFLMDFVGLDDDE
jgi:hypothetical protein